MEAIHVVGIGARTPLGFSAASSVAAVRAGISQLGEHPSLVDQMDEPVRLARDSALASGLMGPTRLIEMAVTALEEICHQLVSVELKYPRVALLLCLPEIRPGWTREDGEEVKDGLERKQLRIKFEPIKIVPYGHAAGLMALETACMGIRARQADLCVILGVDSYLNFETLEWLDQNRQLATSYHRSAFFPGEGAGAFVVASESFTQHSGLESLALIRGTGIASETALIKTDSVCLGKGLTKCVKSAVRSLKLPEEAIDGIICDLNGERYRSEEWGFAMLRLPETFVDPTAYDLPSSCWGDVGAASGSLFIVLAVMANKKGWAKGKRYMIWNSSEAGQRAAAVLELNGSVRGIF